MKNAWQTTTLGDVCGFVRGPFGGSLKKSIFVADGFAVYEQQHAIYDQFEDIRYFIDDAKFKEMQRFELRPNDLIMSCSGTMGKVAIVPDNIRRGIINQALLKLTPSKEVSGKFLKYWMESTDFQDSLKEQSGGAAIQNVASVSILKEIKMPLPPIAEQQRVVRILDEAFEGIATAEANSGKNLQNARDLFQSHLQSVFSRRGKEWLEKTLGESCEMYQPKTIGSKDLVPDGPYPVFGANGVIGRYDKFNHEEPQLLVTCRGATCGSVNISEPHSWITGNAMVVRPLDSSLDLKFLEFVFRGGIDISKAITGAAQPQITRTNLIPLRISFPKTVAEQKKLAANFESLTEQTQRLESVYEQKLAALEALKKSLLHHAFTGQLK